jgi:hypothetical protein
LEGGKKSPSLNLTNIAIFWGKFCQLNLKLREKNIQEKEKKRKEKLII